MNDMPVAARQAFYDQIGAHSLAPLWERLHSLVTRAPATPAVPAHWDYDAVVRPYLMQAGGLITAKQAERRVLILENPGMRCLIPRPAAVAAIDGGLPGLRVSPFTNGVRSE